MTFWLRQEPKESECPSVRACVRASVRPCDIMLTSTLEEFPMVLKVLKKGPKEGAQREGLKGEGLKREPKERAKESSRERA